MKALWDGTLSFGFVRMPVRVYNAVEPKGVVFRLLHRKCGTPLMHEKFCPKCGIGVLLEETARGYEYEKGKFVPLEKEDRAKVPLRTTKNIEALEVVDLKEVSPLYFQSNYYVVPGEGGEGKYALLLEALKNAGKAVLAKVVAKGKERLILVWPHNKTLVMSTMFYPEEVRQPDFPELEKKVELKEEERALAQELIASATAAFDPAKYSDEYRKMIHEIARAKAEGRPPALPPAAEKKLVENLLEALRASVTTAKLKKEKKLAL